MVALLVYAFTSIEEKAPSRKEEVGQKKGRYTIVDNVPASVRQCVLFVVYPRVNGDVKWTYL